MTELKSSLQPTSWAEHFFCNILMTLYFINTQNRLTPTLMRLLCCSLLVMTTLFASAQAPASIQGELKKWHKVTLVFEGPETEEMHSYKPLPQLSTQRYVSK